MTDCHTKGHQVIKLVSGDQIACFPGDLVPTINHVNTQGVDWLDERPIKLFDKKMKILNRACEENWLLFFSHSARVKAGFVFKKSGRFFIEKFEFFER